jgi:Tol biopolymer transport system component
MFVAWTSAGLFFLSSRSGTTDLWRMEMNGGRPDGLPRLVKRDLGPVMTITTTVNGDFYFRRLSSSTRDVVVAPLDPATGEIRGAPGVITQSNPGRNSSAVWSPDGRFLAYSTAPSDTERFDSITIVALDSATERTIRIQPQVDSTLGPVWSPDSKWFLVHAFTKGKVDLYRVDAQTGAAASLGMGKELGGLKLAPDGRTLVYGATASWPAPRPDGFFTRDLETGIERPFFSPDSGQRMSGNLALSADGRQLAVNMFDSATRTAAIVAIEIATGQSRKVVQLQNSTTQASARMDWSPDGKFIYYVERASVEPLRDEIWRVETANGTAKRVGVTLSDNITGVRVSPDGRQLTYTIGHVTPGGTFVLESLR